jgi:hypothetical protein
MMGRACGIHVEKQIYSRFLFLNLKERGPFEDMGIDGRII